MKLQKEYIILTAVIFVLGVILIISTGRNKMSYELPKLDEVESDSINIIEINTPDESILLERNQDEWLLMPNKFTADSDKVNDMMEIIQNLTLTELVSDKKNYNRYELDPENRIHIKAFRDEKVIREFYIGKVSSTYSHTYIRLAENPHVFHARDSFRSTFDQEGSELRDKSVMKFSQEEITGLILRGEFGSFEFKKELVQKKPDIKEKEEKEGKDISPREEEIWVTQEGKKADKSEMNSLLSKLSSLNCDSYLEEKENLNDPVYTIIAKGATDYKLDIYQKREEDKYPAYSSENDYPFLLTKYTAESLMKKPEDIFKKENEE